MPYTRVMLQDGGLQRPARAGDGFYSNVIRTPITADSAQVITIAAILGGLILRSGATAGRTDTSDTAANILAAAPAMDIGDSIEFTVSNTSGFSITLAGGTGVTASGNLIVLTLTDKRVILFKTSATTMDMVAL